MANSPVWLQPRGSKKEGDTELFQGAGGRGVCVLSVGEAGCPSRIPILGLSRFLLRDPLCQDAPRFPCISQSSAGVGGGKGGDPHHLLCGTHDPQLPSAHWAPLGTLIQMVGKGGPSEALGPLSRPAGDPGCLQRHSLDALGVVAACGRPGVWSSAALWGPSSSQDCASSMWPESCPQGITRSVSTTRVPGELLKDVKLGPGEIWARGLGHQGQANRISSSWCQWSGL